MLSPLAAVYHAVDQNRSADSLYMITVPDALTPMMTGTIGLVVQTFLTLRASKLFSRRRLWRAAFMGGMGVFML